jgi:hypothetical protein
VDGIEYTLAKDKLSQADQTYLDDYAKRRDEEQAAAAKAAAEVAGKTVAHKVPGDPEVQSTFAIRPLMARPARCR